MKGKNSIYFKIAYTIEQNTQILFKDKPPYVGLLQNKTLETLRKPLAQLRGFTKHLFKFFKGLIIKSYRYMPYMIFGCQTLFCFENLFLAAKTGDENAFIFQPSNCSTFNILSKIHLLTENSLLSSVFLNQESFSSQGTSGNIWKHFWCHNWGYDWHLVGRDQISC